MKFLLPCLPGCENLQLNLHSSNSSYFSRVGCYFYFDFKPICFFHSSLNLPYVVLTAARGKQKKRPD